MPSTSRPARRQGSVDMVYAMARTLTTNTAAPPAPAGVPTVNDGSGPADPWKECALEHRVDDVVERTPTDARPTGVSSTDQADHAWDKELSRWKAEEASAGQPVDDQLSDERAYAHVLPYAANQVRKGSPEAAQQKIQPLYMETVFREKEALRQRWFIHPTDPPPNAKGCQQIPRQTWGKHFALSRQCYSSRDACVVPMQPSRCQTCAFRHMLLCNYRRYPASWPVLAIHPCAHAQMRGS